MDAYSSTANASKLGKIGSMFNLPVPGGQDVAAAGGGDGDGGGGGGGSGTGIPCKFELIMEFVCSFLFQKLFGIYMLQ